MNPLTVTWAPHLYTEIGWKNFINWMHIGGLDNILFSPNGKLHRLLTRIAFINLLHPFQPFIIGQRIIGPKIAKKFNIPLIIYGENQAEYGNDISENLNYLMKEDFFSENNIEDINFGGMNIKTIIKKYNHSLNDFEPYLPLEKKEVMNSNIKVMYLGYFLKWDPQECFYYASANTGFRSNTERTEGSYSKYSSIDDKIDPFHYFTTYIKFGIGRATYDASQEIRNEKITRQDGIALIKRYDSEFPKKYFNDFLRYIDLNEKEFWKIVDGFRSPHLWEKIKNKWILKHTIY
jgi:N-acetyl sugar amidotransferase